MFTGIVEQIGTIVGRAARGPGARLTIATRWTDLALGESIAVSGVCLTVDAIQASSFEADASAETLERSTLREMGVKSRVNLERALMPTSRLGGHFVGGHVDARGRLSGRRLIGEATELRFSLPAEIARFVAPKGSIAVDGVSLTVNHVTESEFDVVIVPHTLRATTLVDLAVGGAVNLEVDVLARYIARMLSTSEKNHDQSSAAADESILRALRGSGYL
ncbi:MAG: riboflavin synthase [Polyangiales bacterium]